MGRHAPLPCSPCAPSGRPPKTGNGPRKRSVVPFPPSPRKKPAWGKPPSGLGPGASIFAREQDHAVGEIQLDLRQGKVGVVDGLRVNPATVAVLAHEEGAPVVPDRELPKLEALGGHGGAEFLGDGDAIQQPVRPARLGHVPRAVGVEDARRERMAIPVLGAGEPVKVSLREAFAFRGHGLSFLLFE